MKFETYKDFWAFYLREHANPNTRLLHALGTSLGFLFAGAALYYRSWDYLILALLMGYGFAWFSHFFVEKNKPASFKHPWWSFWADMKLLILMITGEIHDEVAIWIEGDGDENKPPQYH